MDGEGAKVNLSVYLSIYRIQFGCLLVIVFMWCWRLQEIFYDPESSGIFSFTITRWPRGMYGHVTKWRERQSSCSSAHNRLSIPSYKYIKRLPQYWEPFAKGHFEMHPFYFKFLLAGKKSVNKIKNKSCRRSCLPLGWLIKKWFLYIWRFHIAVRVDIQ